MTETVSRCVPEPETGGERGGAFEDQGGAVLHLILPVGGRGAPRGATKISALAAAACTWPAEDRIAGHGPACGPSTAKVPPEQANAKKGRTKRLFRKCIPETCAEIEKIRTAGIVFVHQIDAAHPGDRDRDRVWKTGRMEANSGSGFDEIRPVLFFRIERQIGPPEGLYFEPAPNLV